PCGRFVVDLAAEVELGELGGDHRALIAFADQDRPLFRVRTLLGVVSDRILARSPSGAFGSVDDDGRAALLATNLRDFAANLLVCNRVLRLTGLTRYLHEFR